MVVSVVISVVHPEDPRGSEIGSYLDAQFARPARGLVPFAQVRRFGYGSRAVREIMSRTGRDVT